METSRDPAFYADPSRMVDCRKIKKTLEAQVKGTDTYRVKVALEGKTRGRAYCSCPAFSRNGDCKHVAAVLIAYKRHPEWFGGMEDVEKALHSLPRERLLRIVGVLLSSIPQARDFIESELRDPLLPGKAYKEKIRGAFRGSSILDGSADTLCQQLDPFFERARQFYEDKEWMSCLHICYEVVRGCLALDEEWGSTEIFPPGFVSEVWELYLKALRKAVLSEGERETIVKHIETLSQCGEYLFDQEGVYPGEAEDILKRKHGGKSKK